LHKGRKSVPQGLKVPELKPNESKNKPRRDELRLAQVSSQADSWSRKGGNACAEDKSSAYPDDEFFHGLDGAVEKIQF
jgi:hypothetical protein